MGKMMTLRVKLIMIWIPVNLRTKWFSLGKKLPEFQWVSIPYFRKENSELTPHCRIPG